MKQAEGTVCVIDRDCSLLEHLWCLMDIYLAVEKRKKDNKYKLDFYTAIDDNHNESAVGLTDGFIHRDSESLLKKHYRESKFPIELIKKALEVDVGKLDFKNKFYERFLKNAITGIPRYDEPVVNHENYGNFNNILKGIFVSASLDLLVQNNPTSVELHEYIEILKIYKPKIISLDLRNVKVEVIVKLFESLPSSIKEIYINLYGNKIDVNVAMKMYRFLSNLDQLNVLNIYGVNLDLTELLICNKHLLSLALVKCYINDQNIEQLINIIQKCPNLVELNLSENLGLKDGLLKKIDDMLDNNHRIKKLRLYKSADERYLLKNIKPYHFSSVSIH